MNRAFKKSRAEDGFTLIELLIVIVIISILAAIAIPIFLNQQNAAHDASVKSDVRNTVIGVATALVAKPDATGFSVLAPGDTTASVKLAGVPTAVVTVPTGAVAVRAVVTKSNWVTVRGTGADYVVHAQSAVDSFWYEFSSKTGKYTSSSDTPAVTPAVPSSTTPVPNSVQNSDGTPTRVTGAPVATSGATGGTGSGPTSGGTTGSSGSYGATILADKPVVYLPLNETSGPPKDLAGTVANPAAQGLGQGMAGIGDGSKATSFNVPDQSEINLGQPAALENMSAMSVEAIVKQDVIKWGVIVARDNGSGGSDRRSYQFTVTPEGWVSLTLILPNVDVCHTTSVLTPGVAAHVAATFDGSYIRVYFNGVKECEVASSDTLGAPATAATWVGRMYDYATDYYEYYRVRLTGTLAGVAIYNKALTPAQILAHSNSRAQVVR